MKHIATVIFTLSLAACGAQPDRVEDVAANNMAAEEVTEVMDESIPPDAGGIEGGGNEAGANEAINAN